MANEHQFITCIGTLMKGNENLGEVQFILQAHLTNPTLEDFFRSKRVAVGDALTVVMEDRKFPLLVGPGGASVGF